MVKSITDSFNLNDKVAVVTGGYGHLGKEMVLALQQSGAQVIVAGRNEEKFREAFPGDCERILFHKTDIATDGGFHSLAELLSNQFGGLDILVNNAHFVDGNIQDGLTLRNWLNTANGVLLPVFKGIENLSPLMENREYGKVINISSMYGLVSPDFSLYQNSDAIHLTNPPHYGAYKAGVIQLTRYYATLLAPKNIQVNSIAPGPFPNDEIQKNHPEFIRSLQSRTVSGRIGHPTDISGTLILLASDASSFITGQTIQIDGGWTIR